MKLNRLIEITTILLNRRTITAIELAERISVSTRTIYRDIDVLSASGVPVFCMQGANGGISIMDEYTLNRTSLSENERENIIFALQTLQVTKYPEIDMILEKLGSLFHKADSDWIAVDFSPWGSNPNEYNKFEIIKTSIMKRKAIEFDYINSYNQRTHRKIAPLRLMFKSQAWYLWGFCHERKDYRTFRISRIKKIDVVDETFDRKSLIVQVDNLDKPNDNNVCEHPMVHLVLQFSEETLYRLYDDYDDDVLKNNGDGTYTMEFDFPEDDWVYGYIMSFGPYVKVISPPHIQKIIKDKSQAVADSYK